VARTTQRTAKPMQRGQWVIPMEAPANHFPPWQADGISGHGPTRLLE